MVVANNHSKIIKHTVVIKYNVPSALVESQQPVQKPKMLIILSKEPLSLTFDFEQFHEVQWSLGSLIAKIYTGAVQRISMGNKNRHIFQLKQLYLKNKIKNPKKTPSQSDLFQGRGWVFLGYTPPPPQYFAVYLKSPLTSLGIGYARPHD